MCISSRELHQLQADVLHLHDENLEVIKQNLAMTLIIQNGFHGRVEPHKAPWAKVVKLSKDNIKAYIASFKKTVYAGECVRKSDLVEMIKDRVDLFADQRDGEATFINTYCLQNNIVTANYNSRSGSLNDDDKGVALRPDARPNHHHDEVHIQQGITNEYLI